MIRAKGRKLLGTSSPKPHEMEGNPVLPDGKRHKHQQTAPSHIGNDLDNTVCPAELAWRGKSH